MTQPGRRSFSRMERPESAFKPQIGERMEQAATHMEDPGSRSSNRRRTDHLDHEVLFHQLLALEGKRSERTGEPYLLVLIHCEPLIRTRAERSIAEIGLALASCVRVTDITGWHKNRTTIGLICTSFSGASRTSIRSALHEKIQRVLREILHSAEVDQVEISFHFYPQSGTSAQNDNDPSRGN